LTRKRRRATVCVGTRRDARAWKLPSAAFRVRMSGNAKIEAGSCGKPTTKTGTITGSAAITGTGC
jgi:hypothetical protein